MSNSPDISTLISGLSANPSAMGAIAELFKNLGGTTPQSDAPRDSVSPQFTAPNAKFAPSAPSNGGISPELLGALLSMLGGQPSREQKRENGCEERNACSAASGLSVSKTDSENRERLLNALRPYLCDERRAKLDLLLKLIKLAELGKLSGALSSV